MYILCIITCFLPTCNLLFVCLDIVASSYFLKFKQRKNKLTRSAFISFVIAARKLGDGGHAPLPLGSLPLSNILVKDLISPVDL